METSGLTNFDLVKLVNYLSIPTFRGVFMRDELPPTPPHDQECVM